MHSFNILIINGGSSSIKFQVIQMPNQNVICKGLVDRIGLENSSFKINHQETEIVLKQNIADHEVGLKLAYDVLYNKTNGLLTNELPVKIISHRVVHGGDVYKNSVVINAAVKAQIKSLFDLAPLHNPANLKGIEICEQLFPNCTQIAVFDTSFHQRMPKVAYQYAIPNHFLTKHKIRNYGFHGISHKFVSEKAIEFLQKKETKIITIHLGNGCSISAIKNGQCVDHSLGFGPMNGLVMGTRSGDIDQSVVLHLIKKLNFTADEVNQLLQKESGLKGLTGFSDLREVEQNASLGDSNCVFALQLMAYRIKKYIGSYIAVLNGLDAIIFTAGIGENSVLMRRLVCEDLDFFGIEIDEKINQQKTTTITEIQSTTSTVKLLVIPTNEELEIAKQSYNLVIDKII